MKMIYRKVLIDTEQGVGLDSFTCDASSMPCPSSSAWRVALRTLHGGTQEGVQVVEIDNGALSYIVVPTRGMGIWRGRYHALDLGWDSPVKDLVHPALVDLNDRGGLGWLKGFNEWIVRCGLDSNGAPGPDVVIDNTGNESEVLLPLHGKIANTPARRVELQIGADGAIRLLGAVNETMMFGPALRLDTVITTHPESDALHVTDQVTNLNRTKAELELLYHINYGSPILEAGARLVAPVKRVAPRDPRAAQGMASLDRYARPTPGFVEQAYFFELLGRRGTRETVVLLRNRAGTAGSSLSFRLDQLPAFTLWKNTAARENGYVTGLEPATDYPNARRFERQAGRVITLAGGATRKFELTVRAHDSRTSVRRAESEIRRIAGRTRPLVLHEPVADLCP